MIQINNPPIFLETDDNLSVTSLGLPGCTVQLSPSAVYKLRQVMRMLESELARLEKSEAS